MSPDGCSGCLSHSLISVCFVMERAADAAYWPHPPSFPECWELTAFSQTPRGSPPPIPGPCCSVNTWHTCPSSEPLGGGVPAPALLVGLTKALAATALQFNSHLCLIVFSSLLTGMDPKSPSPPKKTFLQANLHLKVFSKVFNMESTLIAGVV